MSRYLSSFGITLLIYGSILGAFFYTNTYNFTQNQEKTLQKIALKIITKEKPKKAVHKKPVINPKSKEEKIVHKKPEKLLQKSLQKVAKKTLQTKRKPKAIKPLVAQVQKEQVITQQVVADKTKVKKEMNYTQTEKKVMDISKEREVYFARIHEAIEQNKHYPRLAQTRNIEDRVKVSFVISKEGELLSYKILEGKRLFHKSVIEAIKQSFPLRPKKNIFTTQLTVNMEIIYRLV